jgi:hypothetical protein
VGPFLAQAVNHAIGSRSRLRGVSSLGLLIGLILISFPAAAEVYPVSGIWTAIDTEFPAAANETCIAVKTLALTPYPKNLSRR